MNDESQVDIQKVLENLGRQVAELALKNAMLEALLNGDDENEQ